MPRAPLPIGTWGQITLTPQEVMRQDTKARRKDPLSKAKVKTTITRARARYRDYNGRVRIMTAFGDTPGQAHAKLLKKLGHWSTNGGRDLSGTTTIGELLDTWFEEAREEVRSSGRRARSPETMDRYEDVIRLKLKPALGGIRIQELTTGVADRALKAIKAETPTQAKHARNILKAAFNHAVRHDALTRNPIDGTAPIYVERAKPRALPVGEIKVVRQAVRSRRQGEHLLGPRPSDVLPSVVDLLLASGLRVAECLGLRVKDLDLEEGRLVVTGQIVTPKSGPSYRKPAPKTESGYRRLHLPPFAVEMLKSRLPEDAAPDDYVFQTRTGNFMTPNQLRGQLRDALEAAAVDSIITPHSFRRTLATVLANSEQYGEQAAADQLGHSGTSTLGHYVERIQDGPEVAEFIQEAYEAALTS